MKLFLVPTPIGNLADITLRSLDVLRQADAILCEDTRTSGVLLKHYDIQKPLLSYHQHNEHKVLEQFINRLQSGQTLALITDAGTPGISDPGFLLLRECTRQGIPVECLPGATAFVPALVQSAIPTHSFVFEGFLPVKKGRKTKMEQMALEPRTMVLYESPHRLAKTLTELGNYLGKNRIASVSRELTKFYEETRRGSLEELAQYYLNHPPKGEIVVVLAGTDGQPKIVDEDKKPKHDED